jgi:uncharacterized membrane protein
MTWKQRYALKSYLRSALWIVPFSALVLEQLAVRAVRVLDAWLDWTPASPFTAEEAQTAMQTIITLNLSFIVFAFGSLLVAIQVASAQMTPRIIATTLLRDNIIRIAAGLFIFTLLFAVGALARTDATVHHFIVQISLLLGFASIVAFLFLIDHSARLLRPVSMVGRVARAGLAVIENLYPKLVEQPARAAQQPARLPPPARVVSHHGTSAIALAVNLEALVAEARRVDGVIEFAVQVGDFVAVGEPLFRLYGGGAAIADAKLHANVAFGPERTIEQDPTFAFRVIIDIALKALSKAINDPTTAVIAIDQLHRLLRLAGKRHLRPDQILDERGQVRVIFRTPNWEDFTHLAFTEIRHCGAESVQIARRLRAMGENLIQTLPEHRHPALRRELDLLDRTIDTLYPLPEDAALARVADAQGLGGSVHA